MKRYGDVRRLRWRGRLSEHYFVRVIDSATKKSTWRSTGFTDRELADAVVHRWQLEAIRGDDAPHDDAKMADAIALWEQQVTLGRSANYQNAIRSLAKRWTEVFGATTVRSICDVRLTAYVAELIGLQRKARTINQDIKCLRAFFGWCVERGWRERNPVTRHLRLPETYVVPRVLAADEEERLLYTAKLRGERIYGYVLLLLSTGFRSRLGETVLWEHVDLVSGAWQIPAPLMKSRREYRAAVAPRLLAWMRRQEHNGGAIIGRGMRREWECVREAAGLPTLKRHDLRRNFVTVCRQSGVKLEVAMALSDHTCAQTMMAHYRRVDVSETKTALESMERRIPDA